jgi:transposase
VRNRATPQFRPAVEDGRSAIIYSTIESCRHHGIEPYTYLHDVLTRLPSMTNRQIKDIVPKAWAAATTKTRLRAA